MNLIDTAAKDYARRLTEVVRSYGKLPAIVKPDHITSYLNLEGAEADAAVALLVALERLWRTKL